MDTTIIKTIGELIRDTRCASNIRLTQLSKLSGINKGTISRIENGEVKRPEFSTAYPLATTLDIPFETLVDYYVENEKRSDLLFDILQATIQRRSSTELIRKVANKYLESPNEDSIDLTEKLYQQIDSIEDTSIKLSLYNLIIDYSRSHGIMPYIAKGLYQQYLIERNDFMRMKETYYNGKYILNYIKFLPQQYRIELYYKLGIHAYNLRLYNESIEQCKKIITEDNGLSSYRVHAIGILRNSYYCLGDYKQTERYAIQYKQFDYPYTRENVILMEALLNTKKGEIEKSIEQLRSFLKSCSNDSVILATNQLLRLFLQRNDLESANNLLCTSNIDQSVIDKSNPLICSRYADYLQIKGEYYLAVGEYETCINLFLEGALHYSKVNDTVEEKKCLNMVMHIHLEKNIPMQKSTIEKLSAYFTHNAQVTGDSA
ncbi:helix-turn-helix transcriptional regulator [Paenibacillaceae sp. P-4]|uniref:helix-turn-helix domain-containing protein n=1 Tax=Paenibacillus TaxID=44249 RepID=UPI00086C8FCE|nr:helix-turn-helix transcriptional regulator [Paenibacillus sp. NAIST15-1]GAV12900.1 putative DNA-binding protein [Paenibacillus sp. NAIST15-1]